MRALVARGAQLVEVLPRDEYEEEHAGKADWAAAGLPTSGQNNAQPTLGELGRRDSSTCRVDERIGKVRERGLAPTIQLGYTLKCEKVAGLIDARPAAAGSGRGHA